MEVQKVASRIQSIIARLYFRFLTGRYKRRTGIGVGIGWAALIAILGYAAGPFLKIIVNGVPFVPSLSFTTSNLTVLWGVHATVITLSLVGLSFAWSSVKDLPTTDTIIEEIAYRLRSIETITFLFTANLLIGAGVLLATDNVVTAEIGTFVGGLLIASVVVTIHRFWNVLNLLLHNTLDKNVIEFAEAALSGKSKATASEYDVYLTHFFDASRTEIEHDRPARLREKLGKVEELLDELLASNSTFKEGGNLWEYIYGSYDSLYRRSVTQQNPELEKQVIASLSGVFYQTQNYGHPDLIGRAVQGFATLFARGYSMKPQSSSAEFLLERFENVQNRILSQFRNAEDRSSFEAATAQVDSLLETHTNLWRTAAEYEAVGAMDYLRHMLDDVHQFREYVYAPPQTAREVQDIPEDSIEVQKQALADDYRAAISQLKFATYGWTLNLFDEGDVSEYFIEQVFSEYVRKDFGSVHTLSKMYFEMGEVTRPLNYWERWNLNRELEKSYGVASTGMAIDTWLLQFYCTALVWTLDSEEAIEDLQSQDPDESPLTEYEHVQHRVDKIIDLLDAYREDYPLDNVLSGGPSTDERCNALIEYFELVKDVLDDLEKDSIRNLPISDEIVNRYEAKVQSRLDSCGLRTALEEVGGITQVETLDQDANAEFNLETSAHRKPFVDDGIPTYFNSNFSGLIDRYREIVLEQFNLEEQEVDTPADVPDALETVVSQEDVALFVVEHMEVARKLRDDERSDRISNDDLEGHFTFMDIPVIRDVTTEFAALALFEGEFEFVEEVDDYPIAVDVTPGEDVDAWDPEDLPDEEDIRDHVRIRTSYDAHIESADKNGVILRFRDYREKLS